MNAEDEVEALAALHATTDVMLQERAAAELTARLSVTVQHSPVLLVQSESSYTAC